MKRDYRSKNIAEHRIIMEDYLLINKPNSEFLEFKRGRLRLKEEVIIHHINGKKKDNRLGNLQCFKDIENHIRYHHQNKPKQKAAPLSPSFPMETKKHDCGDAYEYVRRIVEPIFKKSLQETSKNHRMGVTNQKYSPKLSLYQPHNYRAYIDFSRTNFKAKKPYLSMGCIPLKVINKTEYIYQKEKITIRIKKTQAEIFYKCDDWFTISMDDPITPQFQGIIKKIDSICIEALKAFMKLYGGTSALTILKRRGEHKIKGDDMIDTIPQEQIFYNAVGKKVYHNKVFEFHTPLHASNYLEFAALRNHAPEIANAIEIINPLRALMQKIKKIDDLFEYTALINLLTDQEKKEFEGWLFETVGING